MRDYQDYQDQLDQLLLLRQRARIDGQLLMLELVASRRVSVALKLSAITEEGAAELVQAVWDAEAWLGSHERQAVSAGSERESGSESETYRLY